MTSRWDGQDKSVRLDFDNSLGGRIWTGVYCRPNIGISMATGAFSAGVLVAESKVQTIAKIITMPLRDMFGALFIVSLGALMDIKLLPSFIVPALILIAASFAAKFGNVFISARVLGLHKKISARAGFGLSASGGEPVWSQPREARMLEIQAHSSCQ